MANEDTPKNKIFMWFLKRGVILTKDNLARRNWNGSKVCCFVINLKPSNIFSLIVIILVFSGVQFIGCLVLPLQQAYLTCFRNGQNWAAANTIYLFWQEHRPCAGQSGSQEMISFLTKAKNKLFCRYCSGGHMSTKLPLLRYAGF